jgi:hypothetical protein
MKINLTDDQIDDVVLYEMKRHSELLKSSISDLKKRRRRLQKFEKEDLARFEEVLKSMNIMLGYYGSNLH